MGHIIMPAFALRASLSEDAGSRSGFGGLKPDAERPECWRMLPRKLWSDTRHRSA